MAIFDGSTIATFTAADISSAEALVAQAGWNQVEADWRIFLDLGKAYVIREDTRVIATAAMLPYAGFAWISMVLVSRDHRRKGLATRLMRRAIDDVLSRDLVPILDATPPGAEVYRRLGFVDGWSYQRYAGSASPTASGHQNRSGDGVLGKNFTITSLAEADWTDVRNFDAAAFGADRASVLARLRQRQPHLALIARRQDQIAGYVLGRDGRSATQIGPLVCENDAVAIALLAEAFARSAGLIYVDLADEKAAVRAWLASRGFVSQRPLTRMAYRYRDRFDDAATVFAVAGPELG